MRYYVTFSLIVAMLIMMITGCGGYRQAHLRETKYGNGIRHSDTNLSLFQRSIGPQEMSKAEVNRAIAQQIKKGNTAKFAGAYTGVIKNMSLSKSFYFHHPSRDAMIEIEPNGYKPIKSSYIPECVHGKFSGEQELSRYRIYKENKVYNGMETDFGARVKP